MAKHGSWWSRLRTRFRRHRYDLENPRTIPTGVGNISFPLYCCLTCGKTLGLDHWQMLDLPRTMSHGCPGESPQETP